MIYDCVSQSRCAVKGLLFQRVEVPFRQRSSQPGSYSNGYSRIRRNEVEGGRVSRDNYLTKIQKQVNLQSYSASSGYLGFMQRNGRFSRSLCEQATDLLFDALDQYLPESPCVCSLFVVGDDAHLREEYELDDYELDEYIHPLISKGIVHRKTHLDDCVPYLDGEKLSVHEGLTKTTMRRVVIGVMAVGGLRGHCFFIAEKHGLIYYPHDDTGFGFISMFEDPYHREQSREFVRKQFTAEGFDLCLV